MALEIISVETGRGVSDELFSALSGFVSPEKRGRIGRLFNRQDAVNTLIGDVAVRRAIRRRTGLRNEELIFRSNPYGKPFLQNDPNQHFNVSHSGDLVVCAVNDRPVGVDVEQIKPFNAAIVKRYFYEDERRLVEKCPERADAAFCKIWTMKESYVKWRGEGLAKPLSSFSVLDVERQKKPSFHAVDIRADVCCHVCTDTPFTGVRSHYRPNDLLTLLDSLK